MQKAFPHSRIEQEGREALCRLLNEVPGISDIEIIPGNSIDFCDCVFQLHYPSGIKQKLYVEIKSRGERRFVEAFIQKMAGHAKPCECVLIAPYFSEQSCALLKERGYGFMDLSGNCRIAVESIYIHVSGQPNKYVHEKRNGKYFDRSSNAASKVLRTMLNDPVKVWQVKELTEESDTSLGTVSNIKRFLLDNAWAEEVNLSAARAAGFRLCNIEELIKAWALEYRKRAGDVREYYTLDSIPEFENNAVRWRKEHGGIRPEVGALAQRTEHLREPFAQSAVRKSFTDLFCILSRYRRLGEHKPHIVKQTPKHIIHIRRIRQTNIHALPSFSIKSMGGQSGVYTLTFAGEWYTIIQQLYICSRSSAG